MRLIDADALLESGIKVSYGYNDNGRILLPMSDVRKSIKEAPTIEAEPVKHGRWGNYEPFTDGYRCSHCKLTHRTCTNYCPHCGAKMDLEG